MIGTHESDAANELWRRHSDEEAANRAVQQESAGRSHSPVLGPPPYGNEEVNLMAAEIIGRERERCAQLVESWPPASEAASTQLLRDIAEAIRHP